MIHCFSFSWTSLLNVKQFLLQNCTVRLEYFQMWPVLNKAHVKVMLGYFKNYRSNLILIMLMGQLHSMTVKTKVWQGSVLIYPHFTALTAVNRRGCVCVFVCVSPHPNAIILSPKGFQLIDCIYVPFSLHLGFSPT